MTKPSSSLSTKYRILIKIRSYLPEIVTYKIGTYRKSRSVNRIVKILKNQSEPAPSKKYSQTGINVFGFLSAGLGLGEAARSTVRGLSVIELPYSTCDIAVPTHPKDPFSNIGPNDENNFAFNVFHLNPSALEALLDPQVKKAYLSAGYNIAFWFWETTELPDYWVAASELFDEIWVGSSFCESVVRAKVSKPVRRIPLNVASVDPDPECRKKELEIPERGFLFLTMMDFFSRTERKNPFGAIEAFQKAFGPRDTDVFLIVKLINSGASRESNRLFELARKNDHIIIVDKFLSRSQLYSLINFSDCLISLHRAEGFGLPIAEAMSLGKPVIATGWSANMDFMTEQNSFPVPYKMMTLQSYAPPYPKGTTWADPNIDETARIMRSLVDDPELCREVGQKAREDIHTKFNAVATGQKIMERLDEIRKKT
ncbi:MAG: glycosyltransferase family 4 protein [Deltaproteobacteria bacterium]|nr:glycosyltransferase family 4 protein [Deltaproteobacteria bacterium]